MAAKYHELHPQILFYMLKVNKSKSIVTITSHPLDAHRNNKKKNK